MDVKRIEETWPVFVKQRQELERVALWFPPEIKKILLDHKLDEADAREYLKTRVDPDNGRANAQNIAYRLCRYYFTIAAAQTDVVEKMLEIVTEVPNIGNERARHLLAHRYQYAHVLAIFPDNLSRVMERPDNFSKMMESESSRRARSPMIARVMGSYPARSYYAFNRKSIQSLREWAAPWYPGPWTPPSRS